jgi:hypothetical protein
MAREGVHHAHHLYQTPIVINIITKSWGSSEQQLQRFIRSKTLFSSQLAVSPHTSIMIFTKTSSLSLQLLPLLSSPLLAHNLNASSQNLADSQSHPGQVASFMSRFHSSEADASPRHRQKHHILKIV